MQNRFDFNTIVNSPVVNKLSKQFSEHLNGYEVRVRRVVKDFDLRSRDARNKSRRKIDQFATQLKQTRSQVEKRVTGLLNTEAKRLNERAVEIVKYLKTIANGEKVAAKKTTSAKSSTRRAASKTTKRSSKKSREASI